ncbi:Methyltransferase domain-containing protein [Thiomicrospira sp. ALE5]|nr:Methyltransferase domain-containing protein [Thiomicrospira sp. ALE5]
MMWQFEKAFLKDFVKTKLPRTYLDFAGGTGRVAKLMEENTKANQYILDTSTLMLEVARSHLSKTCILNADFKDDPSELEGVRFDLITAFRFFPNAEPPLRDAAMNFISTKMESGGFLICNNHRNFWSIPYTLSRLTFQGGDKGMLNSELTTLAEKNGFELVKVFSIGKLPQNEFNTIMPWHWLRWIEHKLLSCCTILGYNTIFVFRKI